MGGEEGRGAWRRGTARSQKPFEVVEILTFPHVTVHPAPAPARGERHTCVELCGPLFGSPNLLWLQTFEITELSAQEWTSP